MSTPNVDLLFLINQAYYKNWEEFDLSGMGLTELPIDFDRLTDFILHL